MADIKDASEPLKNGTEMEKEYKCSELSQTDPWTKARILQNLAVFFFICVFLHVAYYPLEALQSSINKEVGLYSMVVGFGARMVTSFLGPAIVYRLTPKWTICVTNVCVLAFVFANFYPTYYTLMPAAILVGMTMGPFWIS
jgi:fucose permease